MDVKMDNMMWVLEICDEGIVSVSNDINRLRRKAVKEYVGRWFDLEAEDMEAEINHMVDDFRDFLLDNCIDDFAYIYKVPVI